MYPEPEFDSEIDIKFRNLVNLLIEKDYFNKKTEINKRIYGP